MSFLGAFADMRRSCKHANSIVGRSNECRILQLHSRVSAINLNMRQRNNGRVSHEDIIVLIFVRFKHSKKLIKT